MPHNVFETNFPTSLVTILISHLHSRHILCYFIIMFNLIAW